MTICELMNAIYHSTTGNPACNLEIETDSIAYEFGSIYEGKRVPFRGVNGRISDIPAYLGNCEVKTFWKDGDVFEVRI